MKGGLPGTAMLPSLLHKPSSNFRVRAVNKTYVVQYEFRFVPLARLGFYKWKLKFLSTSTLSSST